MTSAQSAGSQGRSPEVLLEWTAKSSLQRGKGQSPCWTQAGLWEFTPLGKPFLLGRRWATHCPLGLKDTPRQRASLCELLLQAKPTSPTNRKLGRQHPRALLPPRSSRSENATCPLSLNPPHPMSSDRPHFTEGKTQIQKGQARRKGAGS